MAEEHDEKFETLYAYFPAVVSYLMSLGFSLDEARDLAQDVFVRVYTHMDTYRGESRWAFLKMVAKRHALNTIRARHTVKRDGILISDESLAIRPSDAPQPDEEFARAESEQRLYAAIAKLDGDSRMVVMLKLADNSYGEMAQTLGISVSAVKSRLHVARARLRELLGEDPDELGGE